ncbi:MAG TPA: hypothetical protein VHE78_05825 [Gemmatimonadaceae bacterium]|nr:hypothetical protein [Gemmatimonadaceae bacterium]
MTTRDPALCAAIADRVQRPDVVDRLVASTSQRAASQRIGAALDAAAREADAPATTVPSCWLPPLP